MYSLLLSIIIFSACSTHDSRYIPDGAKERASSSYQMAQIRKEGKVELMISAIYLNDVYPEYSFESAQFLVAFYTKEPSDLINHGYTLTLKDTPALDTKRLDADDLMIELMPMSSSWVQYYFMSYPLCKESPKLILKEKGHSLLTLTFQDIHKQKVLKIK